MTRLKIGVRHLERVPVRVRINSSSRVLKVLSKLTEVEQKVCCERFMSHSEYRGRLELPIVLASSTGSAQYSFELQQENKSPLTSSQVVANIGTTSTVLEAL
jgi:hypothetical protein